MIRAMGDIQVNLDLADSIKVGILSDTHGLLRPEVERILEKCDKIVHAGDFDNKETARRLEQIAPTYMVRSEPHGLRLAECVSIWCITGKRRERFRRKRMSWSLDIRINIMKKRKMDGCGSIQEAAAVPAFHCRLRWRS